MHKFVEITFVFLEDQVKSDGEKIPKYVSDFVAIYQVSHWKEKETD